MGKLLGDSMPEINQNYETQYQQGAPYAGVNTGVNGGYTQPQYPYGYQQMPVQTQLSVRDEFVSQHKKNGLVERLYNGIKNLTGLGLGSKKTEEIVKKYENGEISEEQAREKIQKYRSSQANSAQVVGDAISMTGAITTYLYTNKQIVEEAPKAYLRKQHAIVKEKLEKSSQDMLSLFSKKNKGLKLSESQLVEAFKSRKGVNLKLALFTFAGAGTAKLLFGIINRIGSKEFVTDKNEFNGAKTPYDKSMYSQVRKQDRRDKRAANFRNFCSGAINGAAVPLLGLVGGIVGVPLYFAINSLNRFFIGNHTDEDKSFSKYFENIKNNGILGATLALGVGIPVAIKTHRMSVFEKYSKQAVKKLENTRFTENMFNGKSNYEELSEILLNDEAISKIIAKDASLNKWDYEALSEEELQNLAKELIDKNFFAAKMKQISNDGSSLARVLKEDLKPTRTIDQAQQYIDKAFGEGEYTLVTDHYCLGVGTVAETYFAKGKDGKEVCIKVIKEGINADKIRRDAEAFKAIIDKLTINPATNKPYTDAEKNIYKQNIDNLMEGVLKEIDLANEMRAAEKLAKETKYAKVVKGIKVSDDNSAYVMERAQGISLESLMNLNEAYSYRENLLKTINDGAGNIFDNLNGAIGADLAEMQMKGSPLQAIIKDYTLSKEEKLAKINEFIDKIEAKTPSHGNIKLEPEDIKNLISEYQQVLVEQYNRIGVDGKVVHGDIHPGNIFIDIDALKNMSKPNKAQEIWTNVTGKVNRKNHGIFTLIDTGNVIELSKEQSISLLNLSSYIEHGNYQKIAEYVMQGVEGEALGGRTKEEATKIISDQLKACFTDTTTSLEVMTTDNLLKLTSNIMKKHGIVPNDTQLNLNKAIQSANNSYEALVKGLLDGRLANFNLFKTMFGRTEGASDSSFLMQIKRNMEKAQEKENLRNMSVAERRQQQKMEGNLKENTVEYHIYKLKQGLADKPKKQRSPFGEILS